MTAYGGKAVIRCVARGHPEGVIRRRASGADRQHPQSGYCGGALQLMLLVGTAVEVARSRRTARQRPGLGVTCTNVGWQADGAKGGLPVRRGVSRLPWALFWPGMSWRARTKALSRSAEERRLR